MDRCTSTPRSEGHRRLGPRHSRAGLHLQLRHRLGTAAPCQGSIHSLPTAPPAQDAATSQPVRAASAAGADLLQPADHRRPGTAAWWPALAATRSGRGPTGGGPPRRHRLRRAEPHSCSCAGGPQPATTSLEEPPAPTSHHRRSPLPRRQPCCRRHPGSARQPEPPHSSNLQGQHRSLPRQRLGRPRPG